MLRFDNDQEMIIHAMAMRPKYRVLIEGLSEGPSDDQEGIRKVKWPICRRDRD